MNYSLKKCKKIVFQFCFYKNRIVADDLWKKDKQRIEWLESNGYTVLTVWESDYNKQEVINKCINFINERS